MTNPIKSWEKTWQQLDLIVASSQFQTDVEKFRIRFKLPLLGLQSYKEAENWKSNNIYYFRNSKMATEYDDALMLLLKSHGLLPRWRDSIEYYILFNKVEEIDILPLEVTYGIERNELTNIDQVVIRLGENASTNDIRKILPEVAKIQKELSGKTKRQPIPFYERNKLAYKLHLNDYKYSEIAKQMSEKYGIEYGSEDVKGWIKSYKNQIKKHSVN